MVFSIFIHYVSGDINLDDPPPFEPDLTKQRGGGHRVFLDLDDFGTLLGENTLQKMHDPLHLKVQNFPAFGGKIT